MYRACIVLLYCWAAAHTAAAETDEKKPGEILWKFQSPRARDPGFVFPVIANDKAILVCDGHTVGFSNCIYALNLKTGAILWESDLGNVFCGPPALAGDRMFVTTTDERLQYGKTLCLDTRNGKVLWERSHGDWALAHNSWDFYRVVVCGQYVILVADKFDGTKNSGGDKLICLDIQDGYESWTSGTYGFHTLCAASSSDWNGRVYFESRNAGQIGYQLHSVMASTGQIENVCAPKRISKEQLRSWECAAPAVADGRVYWGDDHGNLNCYECDKKDAVIWSIAGANAARSPAVSGGYVVIGTSAQEVACYRGKDGKELWKRYVGNAFVNMSGFSTQNNETEEPVIYNNQVISVARQTVTVLRLDDGGEIWAHYPEKARFAGRPCAASGILLVPATMNPEKCSLYAFKIDEKVPAK